MNMNEQIELLSVPLPEDVLKHKWHGDFAAAERVIDRRLGMECPEVMRRRLLLEKKIIRRLPGEYPYSKAQVSAMLEQVVADFKPEELDELMDSDYADWIYIEGEPHFRDNLLDNVYKTRPDFAARWMMTPEESFEDQERLGGGPEGADTPAAAEGSTVLNAELQNDPEDKRLLKEAIAVMRRDGGMDCTIRLKARLHLNENAGVKPGETVRVWLPLPGLDAQVKAVRILDDGTALLPEGSVRRVHAAAEHAPQRTIYWEVSWQPGMEFTVEYEYDIAAGYVDLWSEEQNPETYERWKMRYGCFDPVTADDLAEQAPHIVFTTLIRELTKEVIGGETRPLERARRIYDYVTTKVHYSYVRAYVLLPQIPDYAASSLKGDCGVQALLFITMCRQAGIPARWQSGLYANPAYVGNHDWARFYIKEYGWLFADCSFGGSAFRQKDEPRRRFYFGNLEPYRMPSCRRFQTEFDPPMTKLREDPYDAQSGEVELLDDAAHDRYPFESEAWMTKISVLES